MHSFLFVALSIQMGTLQDSVVITIYCSVCCQNEVNLSIYRCLIDGNDQVSFESIQKKRYEYILIDCLVSKNV